MLSYLSCICQYKKVVLVVVLVAKRAFLNSIFNSPLEGGSCSMLGHSNDQ